MAQIKETTSGEYFLGEGCYTTILLMYHLKEGESPVYQRILVPVDNSESSQLAIQEAKRLACESNATLRLLHVVDLAQFAWWNSSQFIDVTLLQKGLKAAGETILTQVSALLKADNLKVETALIEVWGESLAKGIINEAKSWQADLIVMGTHGRTGLTHLLLGSVAEGVIYEATTPVLLIRVQEKK